MVTVTLSTTADGPVAVVNASVDSTSGEWVATLPPMKGGTTPFIVQAQLVSPEMSETVSFDDALFGDVYLASGQSNMAFLVQNAFNGSALVQDANNWPHIRLYTSKKLSSPTPLSQQPEIEEPWRWLWVSTLWGGLPQCSNKRNPQAIYERSNGVINRTL